MAMGASTNEESEPGLKSGIALAQVRATFALAVVISVVLAYVPFGRLAIYPFSLLATWAHELGHGLGALITGNRFVELELYSDLGGQALVAGAEGFDQVVVSLLGLLGPSLLGAFVMILGSRTQAAALVLNSLAITIAASMVLWGGNLFGVVVMVGVAASLGLAARFASPTIRILLVQLIAVQMALALWSSRDYLFVKGFHRDGWHPSDTEKIAQELLLPYWIWGAACAIASMLVIGWAFWFTWLRRHSSQERVKGST